MSQDLVVVGGGITGLCLGHEVERLAGRSKLDWSLLESGSRVGGLIGSSRESGFLLEWGANGFLDDSPPTLELVRQLDLEARLVRARNSAARRYVYRRGRLRLVPTSPLQLPTSRILSPPGKLRLLLEPIVRAARDDSPESVHAFASRRLGREAADILVDAMVSGVFAGDSRRLELQSTFPTLSRMEREHGSLLRGMLARARAGGAGGGARRAARLTSLDDGLQVLIDALAQTLASRVRLRTTVERISDRGGRGYRVHLKEGAPIDCRAVVLACPSPHAASIAREMDATLAETLEQIPAGGLAVVHLGFRKDALGTPPDGFGFLVPRSQGPRILGALFPSNTFEGRAPDSSLLMTIMIGGAQDPDAVRMPDDKLLQIVRDDLRTIMQIHAGPSIARIVRWERGIPQYVIGHRSKRETIAARLRAFPGLWIVGNSIGGVSINDCVRAAKETAGELACYLARAANA